MQLPLARRTILLGLNQVIMMAFGLVVIASQIGTGDVGVKVLAGLQKLDANLMVFQEKSKYVVSASSLPWGRLRGRDSKPERARGRRQGRADARDGG